MDIPLPDEVQGQLTRYEAALAGLEEHLKPLLGMSLAQIDELEPLERAKVLEMLAQAVNSLLRLQLKALGVPLDGHVPAKKEDERLQQYHKKVRKVAAEHELQHSRRSLEVNVAAVNRFINNAIPELSAQQKEALKEAGAQPKEAGGKAGGGAPGRGRQPSSRDAALSFLDEAMADIGGGGGGSGDGAS